MPSSQLDEGTLLNERYRILKSIGQGGMGTVYLATHERLDAVVAVKEVRGKPSDLQDYEEVMRQCEQEARFLVKLNHSNLPKVTDAFIENERVYVVMEFIEGVTLEQRLRDNDNKGLDPALVLEWGLQIADVIAYLHSQDPPIVFRDLKPANIMVQADGNVRLIDFGIARRFQPGAEKDTSLLGSVGYSPPEQFGRNQTDSRSDIYAFGATLHHLLSGVDPSDHPFKFTPLILLIPEMPESLSDLLSQCLSLEPDDRPATIHEVALRLLAARDEIYILGDAGTSFTPLAEEQASPGIPARSTTDRRATASGSTDTVLKQTVLRDGTKKSGVTGSGRIITTSSKSYNPYAPLILAAVILAIIGAGSYVLFPKSVYHNEQPKVITPVPSPIVKAPDSAVGQIDDQNTSANTLDPAENSILPAAEPAATIQITNQDIAMNGTDTPQLRLEVMGSIKGRSNTTGRAAIFFFDDQKNPLPARDPHSPYANKEGQLSVAHSLTVQSDEYPIHIILTIPASEFPSASTVLPIKVQAAVFIEGKRIGESDFIELRPLPPVFYGVNPDQSSTGRHTGVGLGIGTTH